MKVHEYHVHVYFDLPLTGEAVSLYTEMSSAFPDAQMGKVHAVPIGPHTKPMFQARLKPEMLGMVVGWLMLNRRGFDVLVHAVTDDDLADHTNHLLWLGRPVPINLDGL